MAAKNWHTFRLVKYISFIRQEIGNIHGYFIIHLVLVLLSRDICKLLTLLWVAFRKLATLISVPFHPFHPEASDTCCQQCHQQEQARHNPHGSTRKMPAASRILSLLQRCKALASKFLTHFMYLGKFKWFTPTLRNLEQDETSLWGLLSCTSTNHHPTEVAEGSLWGRYHLSRWICQKLCYPMLPPM